MSQNALRFPNDVSSGTDRTIGRRGCIATSIILHIASPSEIWVSASIIPFMLYYLRILLYCSPRGESSVAYFESSSKQFMFDREIEKDTVPVGGLPVKAHRNS